MGHKRRGATHPELRKYLDQFTKLLASRDSRVPDRDRYRLRDEVQQHLRDSARQLRRNGWSEKDAIVEALSRFGTAEALVRELNDAKRRSRLTSPMVSGASLMRAGLIWLEGLSQDIRYAVRSLLGQPTLTCVAALTFALGIGVNAAVFSAVEATLIRPLPFPDAERLVDVTLLPEGARGKSAGGSLVPRRAFEAWQQGSSSFEAMTVFTADNANLVGRDGPAYVRLYGISSGFFALLGGQPLLGHLTPVERAVSGTATAVLSYEFWSTKLGGDPAVLGQVLRLDGKPYEVVGVVAPEFRHAITWVGSARPPDLWVPLDSVFPAEERTSQGGHWVLGRLRPGVSPQQAASELEALTTEQMREPGYQEGWVPNVTPLRSLLIGDVRQPLLMMMGAVGLVLLIASANVANLLLARSVSRQTEITVRLAIGASPLRLARQIVVESLLLALMGAVVGLLAAWATVPILVLLGGTELPTVVGIGLNYEVLAVALAAGLVAGLVAGLAPALRVRRVAIAGAVNAHRNETQTRRGQRMTDSLVVAQLALTVLLVAAAAVLAEGWTSMMRADPGFSLPRLLVAEVVLPDNTYISADRNVAFAQGVLERVRAVAGVELATVATGIPFSGYQISSVSVGGREPDNTLPWAWVSAVTADYFKTLGISLRQGRVLTDPDAGGDVLAVIDEAAVHAYFGGQDPLGEPISVGGAVPATIVGVVGNVRQEMPGEAAQPHVYIPLAAARFSNNLQLVVRSSAEPMSLAGVIRAAIADVDPDVPIQEVTTVELLMAEKMARHRFYGALLSLFAAVGLVIAAAGVYSAMTYAVWRRTREIGVRMAIGASPRDVLRLIMGRAVLLALIGLSAGGIGAVFATRLLSGFLDGLHPSSPLALGATALILLCVGAAASWIPGRRAVRLDPVQSLRQE